MRPRYESAVSVQQPLRRTPGPCPETRDEVERQWRDGTRHWVARLLREDLAALKHAMRHAERSASCDDRATRYFAVPGEVWRRSVRR